VNESGHSRAPGNQMALDAEQRLYELSTETVDRLLDIWRAVEEADGNFGEMFYRLLFQSSPQAAGLFPGDMNVQQQRLTETLGEAVRLAGEPRQLILLLRATGVRHLHYQVTQGHFSLMESALIDALREHLGTRFDGADEDLFRAFFNLMAVVMRHVMARAGSA